MDVQRIAARATLLFVLSDVIDEAVDEGEEELPMPKKRRMWADPYLQARDDGQTPQFVADIDNFSDKKFRNCFRLSKCLFEVLLVKIAPHISKMDTPMRRAIPARTRLQITLMYLATGCAYSVLENLFRVSRKTISGIVPAVCSEIWELRSVFLECPKSKEKWLKVAKGFREEWDYPRALGALDGKHCQVQCFGNSGSVFHNYKGTFSIVLMALVDSGGKFLYCDIGAQGASNDSGVFQNTSLYKAMVEGQLDLPKANDDELNLPVGFHIVADDAFGLSANIFKPYPAKNLTRGQRLFNYRFSRARRIVENCFGVQSSRFRVMRSPILQSYETAKKTIQACCVLHNMIHSLEPKIKKEKTWDQIRAPETPTDWTLYHQQGPREQRDYLAKYFQSKEGAVPFQEKMAFRKE